MSIREAFIENFKEEGREEGLEKGIKKGREEGKEENREETIEIVKRLLAGETPKTIAKDLNTNIDYVLFLQKSMNK